MLLIKRDPMSSLFVSLAHELPPLPFFSLCDSNHSLSKAFQSYDPSFVPLPSTINQPIFPLHLTLHVLLDTSNQSQQPSSSSPLSFQSSSTLMILCFDPDTAEPDDPAPSTPFSRSFCTFRSAHSSPDPVSSADETFARSLLCSKPTADAHTSSASSPRLDPAVSLLNNHQDLVRPSCSEHQLTILL
ncbi:hypothetical protein KFK09_013101 [Dendrobium nobile]|uniref:Uncharacterized protein n=1 Tax=Dendrobium nobile TaxID=94219 RepID=A0A8T3B6G3_DENNO|nr:hypothetical protein KFK09_013101 [Dendrobium nobile]